MDAAIKNLPSPVFNTLCIACWMIWKCKNKLVFNNTAPSYKDLWSQADLYRVEFMEVQERNLQVGGLTATTWKPPRSDLIHKVNVAISQSKKFASVGFGLIIRNKKGEVLAALCDRMDKKLNQLCTIAFVMRKALLFCQSISFSKVKVECNFAELVELLNSDRICSLEVAWTLEDISCIRESFVIISFSSIPLRCNHAVLALASAAKEEEDAIVWLEECPSFSFLIVKPNLH